MAETVIADFVAKIAASELRTETPVQGRIVMNESAVILINQRGKTPIPISSIVDIRLGRVPDKVSEYFEDAVSITYERNDRRQFAVIEADEGVIERFRTVLFKSLLHGASVQLRHPERIGGRIMGFGSTDGNLKIDREGIGLLDDESTFRIDLAAVVGIDQVERELGDTTRPALAIHHRTIGHPVTSVIGLDSPRGLLFLERYLSIDYSVELRDLADLTLSDEELKTLFSLYAGATLQSLEQILPDSSLEETVENLMRHDLIKEGNDRITLTKTGEIVTLNRADQILE
ncbi:MAG: CheF family chemotaxis protein [Halobacteriales archaeon]